MKGGERLLKQAAAQPDDAFFQERLADAPKQEHDFYWEEFWNLHTERLFAEGPIPDTAIWRVAREYDLNIHEQRAFVYIIRCLDSALMSVRSEQAKATRST